MDTFPQAHIIETNGIRMAIHEQGDGPPVLFLHGFPEIAYSWRHQMPAVAAAGFHAIAPDLRGYGGTDKPGGVEQYTMQQLIGDLEGLLDALEIDSTHVVAHDWGALLAWQFALHAPERLTSLVALNIPFFPRPPIDPIESMRAVLGDDFYIVNFQDSDAADRRCAEDPARVFEVMMRKNTITRQRFDTLPRELQSFSLIAALDRSALSGEKLLSPIEEKVYVDAFTAGGFTGPINWYRNWSHNWASTADIEQQITVPTLFVEAVDDVIVSPDQVAAMKPHVTELEIHTLQHCGHWSQQEQPREVNSLLRDWLRRREPGF